MTSMVPAYLTPFILCGMAAILTAALLGLKRALHRTNWPQEERGKAFWSVALLLVGWFVEMDQGRS